MQSRELNNSDLSFLFLLQRVSLRSLSSGRQSKKVYQCCENVRKEIYDLHKECRCHPVAGLFNVFHVSAIRACESRPKRLIAALPPKPNLSFAGLRLSMPLFTSRDHWRCGSRILLATRPAELIVAVSTSTTPSTRVALIVRVSDRRVKEQRRVIRSA